MEASIAEEEFIDMDVSSSSATLFCYTLPSSSPPPQPSRDFEFQMSGKRPPEIDGMTSPADELFFEGKLLPLHLPLRGVEKKLTESTTNASASATPYESCTVSPATSCYVSGELNPEGYFTEEPEPEAQPRARNKRSWTKRLKLIKQSSSFSLRLKASRAYLKSLFTKSGCSDESCAVPKKASGGAERAPRALGRVDAVEESRGHRRSFSGATKRRASDKSSSSTSSSSSSSSFSSVSSNNGLLYGPQVPKRRSSGGVNSEVECSIQGAIAYCKKSQQEVSARKSVSDVEFYALSASRIAADCEKPGISLMLLSTGQGYST